MRCEVWLPAVAEAVQNLAKEFPDLNIDEIQQKLLTMLERDKRLTIPWKQRLPNLVAIARVMLIDRDLPGEYDLGGTPQSAGPFSYDSGGGMRRRKV